VQPAGQRLSLVDRSRVPRQDKKDRLERILNVLFMMEHAPAHSHHHRPMASDQLRKGSFFAAGGIHVE
jgi:hypothetical protein